MEQDQFLDKMTNTIDHIKQRIQASNSAIPPRAKTRLVVAAVQLANAVINCRTAPAPYKEPPNGS